MFAGLEEREDRIAVLAGTTKTGTSTEGILRVLRYYGLLSAPASGCGPTICGKPSTTAIPTLLTLQAYRESSRPYRELWDDGHWVVAIGHDKRRILFENPSSIS